MTASTKAKKHHYVPQFLLRSFCGDGSPPSVWVHERGRTAPYRKGCRRIAMLPDFYAIDEATGLDQSEVEKFLGIIESWIPPIIKRLEGRAALSDSDRGRLAIFTAFTFTRIPRFKRTVDDFEERIARKLLRTAAATEEQAKVALRHAEEELGETINITPKQFREFILDDSRYEVKAHKHSAISAMLDIAPRIAQHLFRMPWLFCHATGRARYVMSDVPVVLADPSNPPSFGTGFALPGAELTLPLTPRLLFIAAWKNSSPLEHTDVDDRLVRQMNRRTMGFCDRYVFSNTAHIDR